MNFDNLDYLNQNLENSYDSRHNEFIGSKALSNLELHKSSTFFTRDFNNNLVPKKFSVIGLICGLPFDQIYLSQLEKFQNSLRKILHRKNAFFVPPAQIGFEIIVLKWPEETITSKNIESYCHFLKQWNHFAYDIKLIGYQINTDGCILAKCLFTSTRIAKIRAESLSNFPFFSKKQSQWCHIPLGRIVDLNISELKELQNEIKKWNKIEPTIISINSLKLVHEKQWFMQTYEILERFNIE